MKIQKASQLKHRQLKSQRTGEEFSLSHVISEALLSKDFFLSHEILRPSSRSSSPHFHTVTEEIIYVLKGEVTATEGDTEVFMGEGDSILFERNSEKYHFLRNNSHSDCHLLVIRKKTETPDVVFP
ncbi:cupin domain-containing protein [Bdellovibrio svalbardensis]|uniref:Cupin domain-containing protein n=1 Tax=Bdellovibrio svalbardensis TaxID=2972972 RepID=A0ABT6DN10_9BACT|nr:cupin domain-containing protein [Bdellovibrio svalbardensis]MDG0817309.1 cupin domain-containing protein [Bdellovibrio svalbardensis]